MTEELQKPAGRWFDTYADDTVGKDSAELEAAVNEYAKRRHEGSSTQNEEELARWKEGNAEIAKEYQWVHPSEYADRGPRIGKILHSNKLISILRKEFGLKCWLREHPRPQKLTLLILNNKGEREVGCWIQYGYQTEFSIMRFDQQGVPLDEAFRGWRTVLLQLMLKKTISERRVNEVFGPARGPASSRYNQIVGSLRTNYLRGER